MANPQFRMTGRSITSSPTNPASLASSPASKGDGLRDSLCDQPRLDPSQASERNCGAVVGMEAFGFDQALAHQPKTALPRVFGGVILGGLLNSSRRREDVQLAVGENAVYVKEQKFDSLGAKFSGLRFGHRGDSSIRPDYDGRTFYEYLFSGYNIPNVFPRVTPRLGPSSRQGLVRPSFRHAD